MNPAMVIVFAVVVAAVLGLVLFRLIVNRRRNQRLEVKYGPEYRRLVEQSTPGEAAREIGRREKRVETFDIQSLSDPERDRFAADWRAIQERFVDDPHSAVTGAHRLVGSLMTARGYPVTDFQQRAADLSVDHALVVEHYREAHAIAVRHEQGLATTEDLRQALVHYRTLFSELLEDRVPAGVEPEQ